MIVMKSTYHRIHHLFDRILKSNTQAWITGTDKKIFSDLGELVQIFNVDKDKKYFFGVELFKLDYI